MTETFEIDQRTEAALNELQELIRQHYPDASFEVGFGDDPEGVYLVARADVDDADEVLDVFGDRLLEMQIEEGLDVYVIPLERTPRDPKSVGSTEPHWRQAMTAIEAPAPFRVAKVRPPLVSKGKISQQLARAGTLGLGVQVVAPDGGETNLHSHPGMDSAWLVLDGEATFYTEADRVVGVLGRNELITIPAGTPYWFKASSDRPLVILHVTARDRAFTGGNRIDYTPYRDKPGQVISGAFFEA